MFSYWRNTQLVALTTFMMCLTVQSMQTYRVLQVFDRSGFLRRTTTPDRQVGLMINGKKLILLGYDEQAKSANKYDNIPVCEYSITPQTRVTFRSNKTYKSLEKVSRKNIDKMKIQNLNMNGKPTEIKFKPIRHADFVKFAEQIDIAILRAQRNHNKLYKRLRKKWERNTASRREQQECEVLLYKRMLENAQYKNLHYMARMSECLEVDRLEGVYVMGEDKMNAAKEELVRYLQKLDEQRQKLRDIQETAPALKKWIETILQREANWRSWCGSQSCGELFAYWEKLTEKERMAMKETLRKRYWPQPANRRREYM